MNSKTKIMRQELADKHLERLRLNLGPGVRELESMMKHGSPKKMIIFGASSCLVCTNKGWAKSKGHMLVESLDVPAWQSRIYIATEVESFAETDVYHLPRIEDFALHVEVALRKTGDTIPKDATLKELCRVHTEWDSHYSVSVPKACELIKSGAQGHDCFLLPMPMCRRSKQESGNRPAKKMLTRGYTERGMVFVQVKGPDEIMLIAMDKGATI